MCVREKEREPVHITNEKNFGKRAKPGPNTKTRLVRQEYPYQKTQVYKCSSAGYIYIYIYIYRCVRVCVHARVYV